MRIPEDGSRCAGNAKFPIDQGIDVGFEYVRGEPAAQEHLAELLGIFSNVGLVGSDVRDRQQRYEFPKDLLLVVCNVSLNRGARLRSTIKACDKKRKPCYSFLSLHVAKRIPLLAEEGWRDSLIEAVAPGWSVRRNISADLLSFALSGSRFAHPSPPLRRGG